MNLKGRFPGSTVLLGLMVFASGAGVAAESDATLLRRVADKAAEIEAELIEIRRHLHKHPELSGEEEKTAALVAEKLRTLGLDVETGVGGHGVVAVLRGGKPGPVVAYRADMDAVRTMVVGDAPYKSPVPGVKHVCGHDAHVAIGIGVAEVLAGL
ncbi:MAG: amidohydrolase, partial [Acidobacteria bacterium]|nr:amidohydrolase [Acidobacteriota bacterium]NIQ87460.1 amidohydrolase [Acidobacteriota bacterium]